MFSIFTPQKPPRTKEEYVYETLRMAITRCELEPGRKLVVQTLRTKLGVSSIPIRSALQRLHAEGFVEITPHMGAIVSDISPDIITEIFMLLDSLENIAVTVAVDKISADELVSLRQILDDMEQALATEDADQWFDLNNHLHLTIAQITDMKMLQRFTHRALGSRDRLRHFYLPSFIAPRMSEAQMEHQQMVDLLEKRDVETLKVLVSQHNNKAKIAYQKLIEEQDR